MKVSVIIPCYNMQTHLAKCVKSILAQTYTNFELLLLDDGSTDGTLGVCNEFQKMDFRIKVYSHPNKGVSYTRNRGIELATGEYIMFIDGDDYVKIDFINKHLKAAEKNKWIISGMMNVRNGIESESPYYHKLLEQFPQYLLAKSDILQLLKFHSLSSPCGRIYQKDIIAENMIRFDVNITYQEDLLFNLLYLQYVNAVKLINYHGYCYVAHSHSSSSAFHQNFEYTDSLFKSLEQYAKDVSALLILDEFIFQTLMRRIANVFKAPANTAYEITCKLRVIFNSEYIQHFRRHVFKSKVNAILKIILYFKGILILQMYFKYLKK